MGLQIYFCGSISGGRTDAVVYGRLVSQLKKYGAVLTAHVADPDILKNEIRDPKVVHDRDIEWLKKADVVIAEVTQPSLGVGYELGRAQAMGKAVYCIFQPASGKHLSCMIQGAGNEKNFTVQNYDEANAETVIDDVMKDFKANK